MAPTPRPPSRSESGRESQCPATVIERRAWPAQDCCRWRRGKAEGRLGRAREAVGYNRHRSSSSGSDPPALAGFPSVLAPFVFKPLPVTREAADCLPFQSDSCPSGKQHGSCGWRPERTSKTRWGVLSKESCARTTCPVSSVGDGVLVWYGVHRAVQGAPAEQEAAGQGGAEATLARAGINTGAFECAGLPVEGMYSWDSPELARLYARVSIRTCVLMCAPRQWVHCTATGREVGSER